MPRETSACGTILVVDDDAGVRFALVEMLAWGGFRAVEAANGEEAMQLAHEEAPQAALVDVRLPGMSGYEVCSRLGALPGDGVPVILLSGEKTDDLDRIAGFLIGADDYVLKPFAPEELLARVRALVRRSQRNGRAASKLSPRETEVLALLADGLSQAQIASRLVLSPKTIGNHIEHILSKLGVQSRSAAVAVAYRSGIVEGR